MQINHFILGLGGVEEGRGAQLLDQVCHDGDDTDACLSQKMYRNSLHSRTQDTQWQMMDLCCEQDEGD